MKVLGPFFSGSLSAAVCTQARREGQGDSNNRGGGGGMQLFFFFF
jgi:hypothetical protein